MRILERNIFQRRSSACIPSSSPNLRGRARDEIWTWFKRNVHNRILLIGRILVELHDWQWISGTVTRKKVGILWIRRSLRERTCVLITRDIPLDIKTFSEECNQYSFRTSIICFDFTYLYHDSADFGFYEFQTLYSILIYIAWPY